MNLTVRVGLFYLDAGFLNLDILGFVLFPVWLPLGFDNFGVFVVVCHFGFDL